ncbi:hypothetical protein [Salipiger abyssi]|uniref:Uncharacterized protein n=1 Tax=Salipiger abyssi TaxID=1250539 RepID=A0A1P8UUT5_9RHOB|nr:hypothetical protein [Salipiger abyssi]APZ53152.1 hypothetical protein Ga0080574_TMP2818 [Salipiger abyssi]
MTLLQGKKTYIVALIIVALVIVEKVLGIEIPGVEIGDDWLLIVLNGLGLGSLRAGIAKGF